MGTPRLASGDSTTTTDISVLDSSGDGIAGVHIIYASTAYSGWITLGTTDANGHLAATAPVGDYLLEANYNQGSARTPSQVDISQPYTFHTVPVTLLNSGLTYATNGYSGWHAYTGPMEMFPGEYSLDTGRTHVRFTVSATGFTGGVLTLLDHNGNGLAGGTAEYYPPGNYPDLPGATDVNGNLVFSIPDTSNTNSLAMVMYYGGTRNQQSRAQLTASNFTFQTALAVVKLHDADGNPLDTGSASYYANGWRTLGTGALSFVGGPTSGGVISQEMLSGSYSFLMTYNHTSQQLNGVAISGPTTEVVFQTGRLTAYFSQPFYWYNSQFYAFSPATQEFLPGQVGLQIPVNGCQTPKFSIGAGDHLVKTGIVATLVDSANHPLAGGIASAYASGWKSVGTTGSNGRTCAALDGHLGNTAVAMVYNGTRQQISQDARVNGIYAFTTTGVTVELRDSNGALFDTGSASYYAGGWHTIGDTSSGTTTVQMLPGSYAFAMNFNGTRQQFNGEAISGTADTVTFQTTGVTVELRDSNGALFDTGSASYYAGGWHTIGDTSSGTTTVQMLPGSYAFAMSYLGTRQQLNGEAISGTTDTVTFQTGSVVSDSATATSYYAGGWRPFTSGMQLLPGTYWFDWGPAPQAQVTIVGGTDNHIV